MTRVVAGTAGGRRLRTPRGERTRPTSDRVREALFSALEARGEAWSRLRVLDLYAGSGALGLEARSRGAAALTAVEHDRATARLVAANARSLGLDRGPDGDAVVEVVTGAVGTVLDRGPGERAPFDLVLADPPYPLGETDLARDLQALPDWLAPDSLVVLERSARSPEPAWPTGLGTARSRRYGETVLWYGHAALPPTGGAR